MGSVESLHARRTTAHARRFGGSQLESGVSEMRVRGLSRVSWGAIALWVTAVALMAIDTFDGRSAVAGRWALFIGLAATSASITGVVKHARRVVLEVMSWEHWMMNDAKSGEQEHLASVRAIR